MYSNALVATLITHINSLSKARQIFELKMELNDHRTKDKQKINFKAFAIPILTAIQSTIINHMQSEQGQQMSRINFLLIPLFYVH